MLRTVVIIGGAINELVNEDDDGLEEEEVDIILLFTNYRDSFLEYVEEEAEGLNDGCFIIIMVINVDEVEEVLKDGNCFNYLFHDIEEVRVRDIIIRVNNFI